MATRLFRAFSLPRPMETRYAKAMEQRRSEMPRSKIMMLISSLSSDPPELSTACSGRAATASREKSGSTLPFHTAAMINVTHDHAIHHSPQVDWSAAAAASCSAVPSPPPPNVLPESSTRFSRRKCWRRSPTPCLQPGRRACA